MASLTAPQGETKEPTTTTTTDDHDDETEVDPNYKTSEKVTVSDLMSKDADDAALQKYKESLLGAGNASGTNKDAKPVKIIELRMLFEGREPLIIPLDSGDAAAKATPEVVILKENTPYTCQVVFQVNNEIVSGLKFLRSVYRSGIRVDKEQIMVGSYAPSDTSIVYELEQDVVPGGMLARATYKSKIKLIDDDKTVHADVAYSFKICKKWWQVYAVFS